MEITCRDHFIAACSHQLHMGAILRAHSVRGELHIQRRADREDATVSYVLFKTSKLFLCNSPFVLPPILVFSDLFTKVVCRR